MPTSTFFKSVCTLPFKESVENRVELVDELPEIVAKMVTFLYIGDYDDGNMSLSAHNPLPVLTQRSQRKSDEVAKNKTPRSQHTKDSMKNSQSARRPETKEEIPILQMELNALVYACGDKFGIPALKALSTRKFAESLPQECKSPYFEQAVDLVFEITRPGDTELRFELIWWCIENRGIISDTSNCNRDYIQFGFPKMMSQREPLAWMLYVEMGGKLNLEMRSLRRCEARLKAEGAEIKAKENIAKSLLNEIKRLRAKVMDFRAKEKQRSVRWTERYYVRGWEFGQRVIDGTTLTLMVQSLLLIWVLLLVLLLLTHYSWTDLVKAMTKLIH